MTLPKGYKPTAPSNNKPLKDRTILEVKLIGLAVVGAIVTTQILHFLRFF